MKQFFSANKASTGAGAFFSCNSKDGSIYLKLIKQTGWNPEINKGIFKGGKSINVKLDQNEAGGIIRAVRTDGVFNAFHSFEGQDGKQTTTIKFTYYQGQGVNGNPGKQGFGLSVKRGDDDFKVGFTLASAESLLEYLRFALDRIHQADYAADKKDYEQRLAERAEKQKSQKPEPETEVAAENDPEIAAEAAPEQVGDEPW